MKTEILFKKTLIVLAIICVVMQNITLVYADSNLSPAELQDKSGSKISGSVIALYQENIRQYSRTGTRRF